MNTPENRELNYPVKNYLKRKLRCEIARSEFRFSAGKLDVLAYDKKNKHFHICEGKYSSNAASVGHAIGQLIAYISMIQENGYDFLDKVSKVAHLELSDFATFMEDKKIGICFYVALPLKNKEKLLNPAQLMLSNMGDFGESIGIFFSSVKGCDLVTKPKPIYIRIRRNFKDEEFLKELKHKFFSYPESSRLEEVETESRFPNVIQIKEKEGNPFLHYEIRLVHKKKSDKERLIEIGFHLEFAKAHLKNNTTAKRKKKIQKVLQSVSKQLKKDGYKFKYERKWGKNWTRLYVLFKSDQLILDDKKLEDILQIYKKLISKSKPLLDKISWGRTHYRLNVENNQ